MTNKKKKNPKIQVIDNDGLLKDKKKKPKNPKQVPGFGTFRKNTTKNNTIKKTNH